MADERLRELERQFRATGDLNDELVWLHHRIRTEDSKESLLQDCLAHFTQKPSERLADYIRQKLNLTLESNQIYSYLILFEYLKERKLNYEIMDTLDCSLGIPIHIITNEDISDKVEDFKKSQIHDSEYPRFHSTWANTTRGGNRVRVNSLGAFHVKYNEKPTRICLNLRFDYAIAPITPFNKIVNLFRK